MNNGKLYFVSCEFTVKFCAVYSTDGFRNVILVCKAKSKVKVSRDRPRWPKGFRVD